MRHVSLNINSLSNLQKHQSLKDAGDQESNGIGYTMKEMVGGCCVCSDERGWPDNPLVYCDGNGCTVAVHQACYGIVTVPTGPWFCRKCESTDRTTKVRCELCPSKAGALKKADTGGWAHVVCALYIPEVRFGNVTSMEPIILQLIPPERFNKICYICQELGKMNRSSVGACMQCNKSGCKQQFHVTCAQSLGLLCEEAGNYLDNVKYCGYCRHHYGKLKKGGNVKTIPPYKPISQDSHSSDSSPEKDGDTLPAAAAGSATSGSHTSSSALSSSSSKNVQSSKSSASSRKSTNQVSAASTSKSSNQSSVKVSTSSTQNYASSNESSAATGSGSSKSSQNKSSSKSSGSQVAKSSHQSEKSSGPKKASSPQESQRKSSTTEPALASSIPAMAATPVVQLSAIQLTTTENSNSSPSQKSQENSKQNAPNKHTNQQDAVASNSSNANTPVQSNVSGSGVSTQQQSGQKFTNSNFTESVITNSDSVFGIETKQTKKRKAVNQAAAANASAAYSGNAASSATGESNSQSNNGNQQWETAPGVGHTPDSTNEEKMKKNKIDPSVIPKSTNHLTGGLNIQMEPNLSQVGHQAHYANSASHTSTAGGSGSNSAQQQSQQNAHESIAGPSSSASSQMGAGSSAHTEHHQIHLPQNHAHKYSLPPAQSVPADLSRPDVPTSLVVSVPLPQTSQGLNLSAHQVVDPGPSSSNSYSSRHASSSMDMTMDSSMSQPSSSGWNLKISYEPQTSQLASSSHAIDASMDSVSNAKRARLDAADMHGGSSMPHDYAGSSKMAMDMVERMSNPHVGSGRKQKRPVATPGSSQMPPIMPSTNLLMPGASATNSMHQNSAIKRNPQPTPPPQTSTTTIVDQQIINDSPPLSPDPDSVRGQRLKPHLDRMGRAPHMLGNELNPESAAAARLSEQLNAELAAHSIFRAPSPLVAPPLMNRASISGRAFMGMPAALGFGGGAQSLDQLLERQWEQGSQFLMEQAQHFDIASLLSCLHQLRSENIRLEEHVNSLLQRRDHLLAVNARLAIPLNAVASMTSESVRVPRDTASNMRQQSSMRHSHDGPVDRAQQLVIREMQQRPS